MFEKSTLAFTRSRPRTSTLGPGLSILALALCSTACGAGESGAQTDAAAIGETQEGISGGVLAANNNAPFASAVKLKGRFGQDCTGTKIGSKIFLTAAHCDVIVNPQRLMNGGTQVPIDGSLGGASATNVAVDRFYLHPSYTNPYLGPSNTSIDAAVLVVSQDTPSIPTMPIDPGNVNDGTALPILGYGCDDRVAAHSGQKQWWNFTVLSQAQLGALIPSWTGLYPHYMFFDGGPFNGDFHQVCDSDSGGPAVQNYVDSSGSHWWVAGITVERTTDTTTQRAMSASTRTGPIATWIITPTLGAVSGTITNILTGTCLTGADQTASGSTVWLAPCDPNTTSSGTQYWRMFNSTYGGVVKQQLQNGKSGLCLDGGSLADATSLTMSTCAPVRQQRFTLTASATTPSEIVHDATGENVGALASAGNLSNNVDLYRRENTNRQRWLIAP